MGFLLPGVVVEACCIMDCSGFPSSLLELRVSNVPSADLLVIQALGLSPAEFYATPSWLRLFLVELLIGGES